jgi:hypothetical protein
MRPRWLPNGHLLVPVRAESPQGHLGDAWREVAPGAPEFEEWAPYAPSTRDEGGHGPR